MSITQMNVSGAKAFLEAMSKGDVNAVQALASDKFDYWVAGSTSMSGSRSMTELTAAMPDFAQCFPDGLRMSVTGITAELQRVAVEAVSHGTTADGKTYQNDYHFLFEFDQAGKITKVREYMDTAHVADVFAG
ncbi:nuclear transport factor 2 family protein [Sphingobium sp. AN558]|uniref:nuclear transport factor 2 family protein n=1 Tax=Sphingobium sp. AN558 TaxID=3133442 RepID=UPI0030C591CA